jgi:hypothetical protein
MAALLTPVALSPAVKGQFYEWLHLKFMLGEENARIEGWFLPGDGQLMRTWKLPQPPLSTVY